MNPADNQKILSSSSSAAKGQSIPTPVPTVSIPAGGKEKEPIKTGNTELVSETTGDAELAPEMEKAGVIQFKETIELPPDMKKLGLGPAGASVPFTSLTAIPPVVLPISDQQVVTGLQANVSSAIKWLATWCVKKLKKAHVALKIIHGKIIRVAAK